MTIENVGDHNWNTWFILFQRDHNTEKHDIGLSYKVSLRGMGALSFDFYWSYYPLDKSMENSKQVQHTIHQKLWFFFKKDVKSIYV